MNNDERDKPYTPEEIDAAGRRAYFGAAYQDLFGSNKKFREIEQASRERLIRWNKDHAEVKLKPQG